MNKNANILGSINDTLDYPVGSLEELVTVLVQHESRQNIQLTEKYSLYPGLDRNFFIVLRLTPQNLYGKSVEN